MELVDQILGTRVTGVISLPAQSGKLEGFSCADITVIATSKELAPHAPNEFSQPNWVRTGTAAVIGRQCTYSINVPSGSAFYLTASGHGRFPCTSIDVFLTPTGAALGPYAVPLGTDRKIDLRVEKVTCNVLS